MNKIDLITIINELTKENKIFPTYDNYQNSLFSTSDVIKCMKVAFSKALVLSSQKAELKHYHTHDGSELSNSFVVDKQSILDVEKLIR